MKKGRERKQKVGKKIKLGKINIRLTNRWLYTLIVVGILAIFAVGIYAYGTLNPSVFGHSSGEIDVDINGDGIMDKTLQQAITDGDLGGSSNYLTKIIEIGEWDMASTGGVYIQHGLTFTDIVSVDALIQHDTALVKYPLDNDNAGKDIPDGHIQITNTDIILVRRPGGFFGSTSFDGPGNRGYIFIVYMV